MLVHAHFGSVYIYFVYTVFIYFFAEITYRLTLGHTEEYDTVNLGTILLKIVIAPQRSQPRF